MRSIHIWRYFTLRMTVKITEYKKLYIDIKNTGRSNCHCLQTLVNFLGEGGIVSTCIYRHFSSTFVCWMILLYGTVCLQKILAGTSVYILTTTPVKIKSCFSYTYVLEFCLLIMHESTSCVACWNMIEIPAKNGKSG